MLQQHEQIFALFFDVFLKTDVAEPVHALLQLHNELLVRNLLLRQLYLAPRTPPRRPQLLQGVEERIEVQPGAKEWIDAISLCGLFGVQQFIVPWVEQQVNVEVFGVHLCTFASLDAEELSLVQVQQMSCHFYVQCFRHQLDYELLSF